MEMFLGCSIDITKPLTKVIMVETMKKQEDTQVEGGEKKQEDIHGQVEKDADQIPITVQYEKLPKFCYCCDCIGHQYKECVAYKNQAKEELSYGAWTKASTTVERLKQRREKE